MKNERVIFISSFNSIRSPMAEGFLKGRGNGRYIVFSAGVAPIRVNPYAVLVMREVGTDISGHTPASVYQYRNENFDYVVTLCNHTRAMAEELLPEGDRFLHKDFVTPPEIGRAQEEVLADFRKLRDEIASWLVEIFPATSPDHQKNHNEEQHSS
jgi:arsenate reductase